MSKAKDIDREALRKIFYNERLPRPKINKTTTNRILYVLFVAALFVFAWMSGERVAYIALLVFAVLPFVSVAVTAIALLGIKVRQELPRTITKNQDSALKVHVKNYTPFPVSKVEFMLAVNEYVFVAEKPGEVTLAPFQGATVKVPFYAKYRGQYKTGLSQISISDFMGLVTLKRKYKAVKKTTVLPRIIELLGTPLTLNLLAEASSPFDIKDEDYSVISDVRPYVPTDSIKRVHWKLTAKRSEWMVKQFQSNGLNSVDIILDNSRMPLEGEESFKIEDEMVESAIALARFCLIKSMPVDFYATNGSKTRAANFAGFESVYNMASGLEFSEKPQLNPASILTGVLNDATGFVNAVVFTSNLNVELYEKIINETNKGNFVAVIFNCPANTCEESDRIFELLKNGGLPVFRGVFI